MFTNIFRSAIQPNFSIRNFGTTARNFNKMARVAGTESFKFNHTMFRIKDADKSLKFYTEVIGMELVRKSDGGDFTNYFLAFPTPESSSLSSDDRAASVTNREGVLELCHNWGTEKEEGQVYVNGNEGEQRGFGHIAIAVDDVQSACDRFTELGVKFKKRPEEGKMRNIAFIYDPDNYWIEIVPKKL